MPSVTYIESNGVSHTVSAPLDRSLMQIAVDNNVPGIIGECGGTCICATCHGYIDDQWKDQLPATTESESFMLEAVPEPRENSRLCCQINMTEALDGIVVRLPSEQY